MACLSHCGCEGLVVSEIPALEAGVEASAAWGQRFWEPASFRHLTGQGHLHEELHGERQTQHHYASLV